MACRLFCSFRASWCRLGALLVRIWPLRVDFWTPKWSQNNPKSGPKRGPKTDPEKLSSTCRNSEKIKPLSLSYRWGWGVPSVGPAGCPRDLLPSLHFVTLRSRPPAEGKAENEDKRNFASNYAASFVLRSSFSLASGISLGALFLTGWC